MGVRVRERVDISKAMRARLLSAEATVAKIRFDAKRRHRRPHPVRGGRYGILEDEAAGAARDSADKEGTSAFSDLIQGSTVAHSRIEEVKSGGGLSDQAAAP